MTFESRYTLGNLGRAAWDQVPWLIGGVPDLVTGFTGPGRIDGATRLAVQLRLARLMGCPVCASFFPLVGPTVGLSRGAVRSALSGRPDHLTPELYGAVSWAGEVLLANGLPATIPEPCQVLSEERRTQISVAVRMEILVHAVGLPLLPHRWIRRTREG